jgi:hypothetical protein
MLPAVFFEQSKPIAPYTLDDSIALAKGTTRGRMAWRSADTLRSPGDRHVRLLFQLKNAKLYSFCVEIKRLTLKGIS